VERQQAWKKKRTDTKTKERTDVGHFIIAFIIGQKTRRRRHKISRRKVGIRDIMR
jgi:hypothetical protein